VAEALVVHLNREGVYEVDGPDSFEAAGPFTLHLVNHGESVHVHLRLEGALSRAVTLDATNHHVEADSERYIHVEVTRDAVEGDPRGALEIVTGYGTKHQQIPVTVTDREQVSESVQVDESLGEPRPQDEGPTVPVATVAVLALAVAAVALTVVTIQFVDATAVVVGALGVLGSVVVALAVLFWG
jgi:hypothetical protein